MDEHVVEAGRADIEVGEVFAGAGEAGDESRGAGASSTEYVTLVRPSGSARSESGRISRCSTSIVGIVAVTTLPPTSRFNSAGVSCGGDPAVVEHHHVVGQPIGLVDVLGGEHDRGAGCGEIVDDVPQRTPSRWVESRWSARRGTTPTGIRRGLRPDRPVDGIRRTSCRRAGRRVS